MAIAPFSVDGALDLAAEERATLFFGVPTMYVRLVASDRVGELAALRLCVSGSAAVGRRCVARIRRRGGQRGHRALRHDRDVHEHVEHLWRRPAAGLRRHRAAGVEVRLGDNDEICVRGPNVMRTYWERPDATVDAFRDGWFLTGDIGEFDADGYLSIVGRSKDLIITGGFNVYPREIEELLAEHPGVAEAAVAGEPSSEWGETVVAYVVLSDGAVGEAELLEWCAARLAKYKRPRHVRFLDALPRNALGKVVKADLTPKPFCSRRPSFLTVSATENGPGAWGVRPRR